MDNPDQLELFDTSPWLCLPSAPARESVVYAQRTGKITDHIRIMQLIERINADPADRGAMTGFYELTRTVAKKMLATFAKRRPVYYEPDEWSADVAVLFYEKVFVKRCEIRSSATTVIGYLCLRRLYYRRKCELESSLDEYRADLQAGDRWQEDEEA